MYSSCITLEPLWVIESMGKLFLKSARSTALLDIDTNTVNLKGKQMQLEPNIVVSVGDTVRIRGEEFTAYNLDPLFFKEYAKRTAQIIQPWDAATIVLYLSITPGKKVLESGAGSGALSIAILKAIGESGRLTTVEIDEINVNNARENVSGAISIDNWSLVQSSIESFSSEEKYDAAVLDIPEPWNAIGKIAKLLKPGSRICCYSPNYNQLEKNVSALKSTGFEIIESLELLKRRILVRENATRPDNDVIGHTAFMTFAAKLSGRETKI